MPDYPLPSSNPEALGFALKPLEHLDRLIREHIEGRAIPARRSRWRARQAGAVPHLWRREERGWQGPGIRRDAVPAVQPDQGVDLSAVWTLVEEGELSFMDKIADPCRSSPHAAKAT